jgi:hypothetical protein
MSFKLEVLVEPKNSYDCGYCEGYYLQGNDIYRCTFFRRELGKNTVRLHVCIAAEQAAKESK